MSRLRLQSLISRLAATGGLALASTLAQAAEHSSETMDKVADVLTWIVIVIVPIVGVAVFLLVHVLPEKFAEKRKHPQAKAIQVLCLLSLVFGGMLWPLAWLWAFTKPVGYKLAYGTDVLEEHGAEPAPAAAEPNLREQVARLKGDVDRLAASDDAPQELKAIRDQLAALEPRLPATGGGTP